MLSYSMRSIALFLVLLTVPAGPVGAEVTIGVRSGDSSIVADQDGIRARIVIGKPPERPPARPERPKRRIPRLIIYRERVIERAAPRPEPVAPPAIPTAPIKEAEPEAETLDPAGPARLVRAPGAARTGLVVGDQVPRAIPHVTLDPERFGLSRPPEGEIYARVGSQILRITNSDRVVTEIVVP